MEVNATPPKSVSNSYQLWYIPVMNQQPILDVRFFKTEAGTEPVRDWLRTLSAVEKKAIGEDIKTVQFGWPQIGRAHV